LTPAYQVTTVSFSKKVTAFVKYLLPLVFVVFLVTGLIIFGIATPTEAAALGCLGSFILAAFYRSLNWQILRKAVGGSVNISAMVLAILVAAIGFSQILAYTGASRGLLQLIISLPIPPMLILIFIQIAILFLGTFMEQIAIMLITLPILMPIVNALNFDPIWFGIIMLINLEMALTSPPFGVILFVMKGVAPKGTSMREIYLAGLPFLICDAIAIAIVMAFPQTVSWFQNIA
jgi:tripartite ATP-independent transporter DctM subunit